jgi:Xaa-Pro aminopeptidase
MNKNLLTIMSLLTFSVSAIPAVNAEMPDVPAKAIIAAPSAPKFTDAERQTELARRRTEVFKRMEPNSAMILWSAEIRNYAGDVDFMYRQENNLFYLTSLKQQNATLVLVKNGENVQEILFLPKRNPAHETWNGKMYSNEEAGRLSGVKTIIDSAELPAFLEAFKAKKQFASNGVTVPATIANAYFLLPESDNDDLGIAEFRRENEYAKSLTGYKIVNARSGGNDIFGDLRLVKSPYELKLLQHAVDISTEAHMRAMATGKRVKWEYETQAEIEYVFRRRNADYWGYPSIVGCGPNATTLHYVESQGEVKPGSLLLMDVGAEYEHYTADVTRTFPTNGKFTKEQAEIYQVVYDAQEAAAKTIKPGAKFTEPSRAATKVIREGLAKLGLITAPDATYETSFNGVPSKQYQASLWFMHGWGHWLGMNVHDVGAYNAAFKPGMVMTNEPGIYIREDALDYLPDTPANKEFLAKIKPVFEKYKNIGVRLEDDMLVTETGVEWMTKKLPRSIADVEAFMAKSENEVQMARVSREVNPAFAVLNYAPNAFGSQNKFGFMFSNGATARQGWIKSGKAIASDGGNHKNHPLDESE